MTVTMETVLTQVGTFLSSAVEWLGTCIDTIAGNPILFVMVVAMPIAGFAVGLLSRLIRL
jgi:hypothetical protein